MCKKISIPPDIFVSETENKYFTEGFIMEVMIILFAVLELSAGIVVLALNVSLQKGRRRSANSKPIYTGVKRYSGNRSYSGNSSYSGNNSYSDNYSYNDSDSFADDYLMDETMRSNQMFADECMRESERFTRESLDFAEKCVTPFEMGGFDTNAFGEADVVDTFDSFGGFDSFDSFDSFGGFDSFDSFGMF